MRYHGAMDRPRPARIARPLLLSAAASLLVWLPFVSNLADGGRWSPGGLAATVLADLGLCGLVWLNWALRRRR